MFLFEIEYSVTPIFYFRFVICILDEIIFGQSMGDLFKEFLSCPKMWVFCDLGSVYYLQGARRIHESKLKGYMTLPPPPIYIIKSYAAPPPFLCLYYSDRPLPAMKHMPTPTMTPTYIIYKLLSLLAPIPYTCQLLRFWLKSSEFHLINWRKI